MADASDDRWRDSLLEMPPQTIAAPGEGEDGQHEHKRARMDPVDAVRVLKGLRFARFLKNKKEFSAAMGAAVDFERDDDEFHPRDSSKDPSRRTFQRGATKVDICGMLLQRREFKADRLEDRIAAIQLFTDSSPTAGVELQGMVMEVVQRSLHVRRTILPGSTLAYGQFDAVSKGVVLLYALWLVSGPFFLRFELHPWESRLHHNRLRSGSAHTGVTRYSKGICAMARRHFAYRLRPRREAR